MLLLRLGLDAAGFGVAGQTCTVASSVMYSGDSPFSASLVMLSPKV